MAKYRKVDSRIWNDARFMQLSDNGKLAFFFVLTHPNMTAVGAMRHTIPGLGAEIGWSTEAFREAFLEATANDMVRHDERASFIWLPNFIKYNQPESPNVVVAWVAALELLPECQMRDQLILHIKDFLKGFGEGFQKAFAKALPKSMPNQEQEQEHLKEKSVKESVSESPQADSPDRRLSLPCEDGSDFEISDEFVAELNRAYPSVDIQADIAKARAWLAANPDRKKTRKGMKRFVNSWMSRAQEFAESKSAARDSPPKTTGRQLSPEDRRPAKWLREAKI